MSLSFAVSLCPLTLIAALLLLGCDGKDDPYAVTPPPDCSTASFNAWLLGIMQDRYLWYDQVPALDPAAFSDPEALLAAAKFSEFDRWSYLTEQREYEQRYEAGEYIGFGWSGQVDGQDSYLLHFVYRDSPAARAGLHRGDRLLAIDGESMATILTTQRWDDAFGPDEVGVSREFEFQRQHNRIETIELRKAVVPINTVLASRNLVDNNSVFGYLALEAFLETTRAELRQAFAELSGIAWDGVVLDLRYNHGGRLEVAAYLASLLVGRGVTGETFVQIGHNDRYRARDYAMHFETTEHSRRVERIAVISSEATCSASESVINGLVPFAEVALIGSETCGKPVGSYAHAACGKSLSAIQFAVTNANGAGDYFHGLAVTCPARDDLQHRLGDPTESALATALAYLATGECPTFAATTTTSRTDHPIPPLPTPTRRRF